METRFVVVVGSKSPIKVEAAKQTWPEADVRPLEGTFSSSVPEQPIGKSQTKEGALFRVQCAIKSDKTADIWVGIENGIYEVDAGDSKTKWVDAAAIYIVLKGQESKDPSMWDCIWSDEIDVPTDDPSWKKGPNGEWSILKDPHSELTRGKRPRKVFLSDAMRQWKQSRDK